MPVNPNERPPLEPAIDRLRLKPPFSANGFVDGGWWPRSGDLTAEAPTLVEALADRIGPVWRVAFAPAGWAVTAGTTVFRGRLLRLEGISTQDRYVVHVTGGTMRRVTLLVVPPEADAAAAGLALAAAAGQDNEASPETILDDSGALPGRRDSAVSRWESEGGATRTGETVDQDPAEQSGFLLHQLKTVTSGAR
ncbi:DUF5994 family protein [Amycolatopsis sp. NPDC051061]|uniref:DUF5994 family protein n=1 Tax=Amycolatopsis sp. NPDC051061 TaxID=3155042 RepID=UPI003435D233